MTINIDDTVDVRQFTFDSKGAKAVIAYRFYTACKKCNRVNIINGKQYLNNPLISFERQGCKDCQGRLFEFERIFSIGLNFIMANPIGE